MDVITSDFISIVSRGGQVMTGQVCLIEHRGVSMDCLCPVGRSPVEIACTLSFTIKGEPGTRPLTGHADPSPPKSTLTC